MKYIYSFCVLMFCALFVACGSTPVVEETVDGSEQEQEQGETAVIEEEPEPIEVLVPQDIIEIELDNVFYFDFDKSDIKPEAYSILDEHAEVIRSQLVNNPELVVVIEGHCDERGTEEYNIALGERRAQAVSRYLRVQGVSADNIATVSYGELDPADPASDEFSWAQNRRAVLAY